MRLAVLLRLRIVELEGTKTSTGHEKEGDVLDILNFLLVRVLIPRLARDRGAVHVGTYTKDLQDVGVPHHYDPCSVGIKQGTTKLLTVQSHCLRAAFFHRRRYLAEDGARGLTGLVPARAIGVLQ